MAAGSEEMVIELRLPSDPKYLSLVRTVVSAAASVVPTLSDARSGDLKLVATELFTNAMEANWRAVAARADQPDDVDSSIEDVTHVPTADVHLRCMVSPSEIEVTVVDHGLGFDAPEDPHPPVEDPSRLEFESGLGLPLIQYLADEVDYASGPEGTRATVVMRNREGRSGVV